MNLVLRPATRQDLPALLEIERESFSHPHWTGRDFLHDPCTIAEVDGRVAGLLVWRETFAGDTSNPPEREILNLAVARDWRRKGIATALLKSELQRPISYFLEVRESNLAAQELYRRFGFVDIGGRRNYYQSPVESAIVMQMKWC